MALDTGLRRYDNPFCFCQQLDNRFGIALRDALHAFQQLAPAHCAVIAQDRDGRHAAAFDDDVTLLRRFYPVHLANPVA